MNTTNTTSTPSQQHSEMQQGLRIVQLEGAFNMRDLGGYMTKDGEMTRWGKIYRADGLHRLTAGDRQTVVMERRIGTMIDLRHIDELREAPNVFADSDELEYHNVNLIDPAALSQMTIQSLGELYVGMLDGCQPALRKVFELLADHSAPAALFHCKAGKDRTGVIAGMLLDLAGVPREAIVGDYSLTAGQIAPLVETWREEFRQSTGQEPNEQFEKFMGSDGEHMELMLDHLYARYGGSESYVRQIGLTDVQIQSLIRLLLE